MIDAMLPGERNLYRLARIRDQRCKESQESISVTLQGNDQDDLLPELEVVANPFCSFTAKLKQCELAGRSVLAHLAGNQFVAPARQASQRLAARGNEYSLSPKVLIESISDPDLLGFPGLVPTALITVISECGLGMTRWPSEKHCVSCFEPAGQDFG